MSTENHRQFTGSLWNATQSVAIVRLVDEPRIIRIKVRPSAKAVIAEWAAATDMKEQGVASRIYEWFASQDESLQRAILGLFGPDTPDIAKLILERMEADRSPNKRSDAASGAQPDGDHGRRRGRAAK